MKRKFLMMILVGSGLLSGLTPVRGTQIDFVSVMDVVQLAMTHNPHIQGQVALVALQHAHLQSSGLWENPEVVVGYKQTQHKEPEKNIRNDGWVLGFSQELSINGQLGWEQQAAWWEYHAERAGLAVLQQKLARQVLLDYLTALAGQERIQLEQRRLSVAQASLEVASQTYQGGVSGILPYQLARTMLEHSVVSLEQARHEYQTQFHTLMAAIGLPDYPVTSLPNSLDRLEFTISHDSYQNPEWEQAYCLYQARTSHARAAQRAMIPNPKLAIDMSSLPDSREGIAAISIPIPLLNSGRAEARAQVSRASNQAAQLEAVQQSLISQQMIAETRLVSLQRIVEHYQLEVLPSLRAAEQNARHALETGTENLSLLLELQHRLIDYEFNYLEALLNLQQAKVETAYTHGSIMELRIVELSATQTSVLEPTASFR